MRKSDVQIEADVVSWMDLWFLEHMPDEKEGDPHERQEHHAQCELFAKVVINTQVPVWVGFDIFASETHTDRKEQDGQEGKAQLNEAEDWGGDELIETAGGVRGEMEGVFGHGGYVSGRGYDVNRGWLTQ